MSTYEVKFTDVQGCIDTIVTIDQPDDINVVVSKLMQGKYQSFQDGPDHIKIINMNNIVSIDIDRVKGELNDQT